MHLRREGEKRTPAWAFFWAGCFSQFLSKFLFLFLYFYLSFFCLFYLSGITLDAHNPHTPYAHMRAHPYTRKEEIGRLSSLQCKGNTQYHRTRMHVCMFWRHQGFETWWVASHQAALPLDHRPIHSFFLFCRVFSSLLWCDSIPFGYVYPSSI